MYDVDTNFFWHVVFFPTFTDTMPKHRVIAMTQNNILSQFHAIFSIGLCFYFHETFSFFLLHGANGTPTTHRRLINNIIEQQASNTLSKKSSKIIIFRFTGVTFFCVCVFSITILISLKRYRH